MLKFVVVVLIASRLIESAGLQSVDAMDAATNVLAPSSCVWPTLISAPVSQAFNAYNLYDLPSHHHLGLDIQVPVGSPVYASLAGVVTFADIAIYNYGRHIEVLSSNGYLTIYGHLLKLLVTVGDVVQTGQLIGLSGGALTDPYKGSSTGPHLHWEIRPAGHIENWNYAIDPEAYCLSFQKGNYLDAIVITPDGLQAHSGPSLGAPVIESLNAWSTVQIMEVVNGFGKVKSLRPEWVEMRYLKVTGGILPSEQSSDVIDHYVVR